LRDHLLTIIGSSDGSVSGCNVNYCISTNLITDSEPSEEENNEEIMFNLAEDHKQYYICLDTETGSSFTRRNIIQLAYVLYDNEFNKVKEFNKYIKNRPVNSESFKVHGISSEFLEANGEDFMNVIFEFLQDIGSCHTIIGHNVQFDIDCILTDIKLAKINVNGNIFEGKKIECTMKKSKDVCKITNDKGIIKAPSNNEMYEFFFGKSIENAHDALVDVNATMECYIELVK